MASSFSENWARHKWWETFAWSWREIAIAAWWDRQVGHWETDYEF